MKGFWKDGDQAGIKLAEKAKATIRGSQTGQQELRRRPKPTQPLRNEWLHSTNHIFEGGSRMVIRAAELANTAS